MYQGSIHYQGGSVYRATTTKGQFTLATGGAQGSNPVEAMLASLCACMGHHAKEYFQEAGLPEPVFDLQAQADLAPDQTRLTGFKVAVDLAGTPLTPGQTTALLDRVRTCHIYRTLRQLEDIPVTVRSAVCP